jgi:hypothetical protein
MNRNRHVASAAAAVISLLPATALSGGAPAPMRQRGSRRRREIYKTRTSTQNDNTLCDLSCPYLMLTFTKRGCDPRR